MYLYGKIQNGAIKVQRFFKDQIVKLEGKEVEIRELDNDRTSQQNRYMWGVVYKLISDHTGFTPEEVHEVYKKKFLTYEKKGFKFTKSTTDLKVKEFGEYLDKVINHAQGELGLIIPEAEIAYEDGINKDNDNQILRRSG